jgi:tRNA G26 N,N-dimethylase Trm1
MESLVPYLNCSRCGLAIRRRIELVAVEHCPRCAVRARAAVPMFRTPLPARTLAAAGTSPVAPPVAPAG